MYESEQVRSYKFVWISHLVKYVRIAVRSGWTEHVIRMRITAYMEMITDLFLKTAIL